MIGAVLIAVALIVGVGLLAAFGAHMVDGDSAAESLKVGACVSGIWAALLVAIVTARWLAAT